MVTEGDQLMGLAAGMSRLEAKVDIALTQTSARLEEHTRMIAGVQQDVGGLEVRMQHRETVAASYGARLEMTEKAVANLNERRNNWPAAVSAIIAALALIALLAQQFYGG